MSSLIQCLLYGCAVLNLAFSSPSVHLENAAPGETFHQHSQFVAKQAPAVLRDVKQRSKRSDDPTPLSDVVQGQAVMIQTLQAEMTALKAEFAALKRTTATSAAFSVRFNADPVNNVGVHATLKFDAVAFNQGGYYNAQSGIFTAPSSGLYVFFVSLMGSDNRPAIDIGVMKSGQLLDIAWAEGQSDLYDQGSCLTTTHLMAGEQVWVQHWDGETSFRGAFFTTFSGFLLHADP